MTQLINTQFTLSSSFHDRPMLADLRFQEDEKEKPLIIFCHGFKGFKDWGHFNLVANEFANRGYAFLKFNFSHNGTTIEHPLDFADLEAFGHNNITKELNDLKDIIDAVTSDHPSIPDATLDKKNVFLIGHSRGGGIVYLKMSEDDRITTAAGWAPIDDYKKRYSDDELHHWEKAGVIKIENSRTGQEMPLYYQLVEDVKNNPERVDIPKAIKSLNRSALAIHGTADETLDFRNTKALNDLSAYFQLELIQDANHTFGGSHPWTESELPPHTRKAIDITDRFFQQSMRTKG